jgi:hypothetical protein
LLNNYKKIKMKKIVILLCVSFFALVSCSKDESSETKVPLATATQAVIEGAAVKVTWPAVTGSGITYNVYRNEDPVKINVVPLIEPTYTDVLKAVGSYTYKITVNLAGKESEKGVVSAKVVFELPQAPSAQAVLDGGSINITWASVAGTGITYNIYRNENSVKINTAPLTDSKFTDVLKATGSYTYTITANLVGLESAKGIASEKVVLALPKTITSEDYDIITYKTITVPNYDSMNITKLLSVSHTFSESGSSTMSKSKVIYTYTGNLITKEVNIDDKENVEKTIIYTYNDKNKIITNTTTESNGEVVKYVYVYNSDVSVTSTEYKGFGNGTLTATGYTYGYTFFNGNLFKEELLYKGKINSYKVYTFDTKINPCRNILGFSNLFGVISSQNNVTNVSDFSLNASITRSEFTYDANGNVLTENIFIKYGSQSEKKTDSTIYSY